MHRHTNTNHTNFHVNFSSELQFFYLFSLFSLQKLMYRRGRYCLSKRLEKKNPKIDFYFFVLFCVEFRYLYTVSNFVCINLHASIQFIKNISRFHTHRHTPEHVHPTSKDGINKYNISTMCISVCVYVMVCVQCP